MTDPGNNFERRVTEALESGAEDAPSAMGLVAAARERNRRRVRTRTTGVVAATVLAVAAVSVTWALGSGNGSRSPGFADTPTPTSAADPDSRTETYRDLEITVPSSWGYGSLATWCLNGNAKPGEPVVERPGGAMPSIACTGPESGYGAQFFDASFFDPAYSPGHLEQVELNSVGPQTYPAGSWLGYQTDASSNLAVIVVAPTEAVARQVLDSVRTVDGADANGCSVRRTGTPPELTPGTVSVCRYAQDGWLDQSELLTGEDAVRAAAAVAAVEPYVALGPGACTSERLPGTTVLLTGDAFRAQVTFGTGCFWDDGVFTKNNRGLLTKDVMYWALSPGFSGGFDGDVPLPDRLRGQEGPG